MPNLKVLKTDLKCPDALFHFAKGSEKLQHLEFYCHGYLDVDNATMKSAFKMFFEKVQFNLKHFSIKFMGDFEDEPKDNFLDCFEFMSLCQELEEVQIGTVPLSVIDINSLARLPNLKKTESFLYESSRRNTYGLLNIVQSNFKAKFS